LTRVIEAINRATNSVKNFLTVSSPYITEYN